MQRWRSLVETTKHQIYISRARDPFLNLSIEHFLLQKTKPHSTILFLYINEPCVVIGRNQNPWLEVNQRLLKSDSTQLVRRRSGGGAVFHDEGNVNYSVICPPADFTRDKHAEMVTKAIRTFNDRARVNERHDIVLDGGPLLPPAERPPQTDMHQTKYMSPLPPLKISGSAYKLVRNRSLHHGTCLVASPNLANIGNYLKSPARAFMKARGVDSVRSPVGNASSYGLEHALGHKSQSVASYIDQFQARVVDAFAAMYGLESQCIEGMNPKDASSPTIWSEDDTTTGYVGTEALEIKEIADGVEELKSPQWIYGQTPQFTLSTHATEEDDRERPSTPQDLPSSTRVFLKARGGAITETNITLRSDDEALSMQATLQAAMNGKHITEIRDFRDLALTIRDASLQQEVFQVLSWLNKMFAKVD